MYEKFHSNMKTNDCLFFLLDPDYLRKIIVQGRSSKNTKVGDIMTEEVGFLNKIFSLQTALH